MRNKFIYSIILAAVAVLFASCGPTSKESYLKQFDSFVNDVELKADNYSEKDWEKAEERFEDFTEEYYERFSKDLNNDDKMQLGRCVARYHKVCIKHSINKISSAASMLEGYAKEMGGQVDPMQQLRDAGFQVEELQEGPDISDLFE